jgi:hypothetical protein
MSYELCRKIDLCENCKLKKAEWLYRYTGFCGSKLALLCTKCAIEEPIRVRV